MAFEDVKKKYEAERLRYNMLINQATSIHLASIAAVQEAALSGEITPEEEDSLLHYKRQDGEISTGKAVVAKA